MGLPFFKSVQREGLDGVKFQRAGDDLHRWAVFRVCMLVVIDSSIKSQGDASTDSKSRNFLRKVRRRSLGFSETRSTLSTRGGHHRNYTSLADKRKVRRRFLCFSENACSFVKRAASALLRVVQKAKGRRSEIEGAPAQKSKRRRSEIEEASLFQKAGFAGSKRLSTRVKEQYHHLLLGNPYICRPSSFMARQT